MGWKTKELHRAYNQKYQLENKEKIRKQRKQHYYDNREIMLQRLKINRQKNGKQYNAQKQQYRKQHLALMKERDKQRNLKPERKAYRQKYNKEYYIKTKLSQNRKSKEYRLLHQSKLRAYDKKYNSDLKDKVFKKLGNKCVRCGCIDKPILQIDHIQDNGYFELQNFSWKKMYQKILDNPEGYQILCPNCNWIKRFENNKPRSNSECAVYGRQYNLKTKLKVYSMLGGKCVKCGNVDSRVLQIDHINGKGHEEITTIRVQGIRRKILKGEIADYQLLCANCNWTKRVEKKEYFFLSVCEEAEYKPSNS